jgi:hypothetical protein
MGYLVKGLELFIRKVAYTKYDATVLVRRFNSTKTNRLMLFRGTVAVYWENHMGHTNTLCVQNAEF